MRLESIAFCLVLGTALLSASEWKLLGPDYEISEGITYNVLPHPAKDGEVLVGVRPQGLMLTTDDGETWVRTSKAFAPDAGEGPNPESMERAPSDPQIVYAGLELRGAMRSDDGGRTWRDASRTLPKRRARNGVSVAIHPSDPDVVWLGTDGGLFKSADGGKNWRRLSQGLPTGKTTLDKDVHQTVSKILVDPRDPQRVVIGLYASGVGEPAGVWRSADGGESWVESGEGLASGEIEGMPVMTLKDWVLEMTQSASNPEVQLLATPIELYHSSDGGRKWVKLGDKKASAVAGHPTDPKHFYIGLGDGGVEESRDGGRTWTDLSAGLPRGQTANAEPITVEFTDTNGKKQILTGMDMRFTHGVIGFTFDPKHPEILYVAAHAGVYRLDR